MRKTQIGDVYKNKDRGVEYLCRVIKISQDPTEFTVKWLTAEGDGRFIHTMTSRQLSTLSFVRHVDILPSELFVL